MNILALHGFTGVGADFAPFAERCDLGPWHYPNLPGHGPEPSLDCSPEATVEYIQTQVSVLPPTPRLRRTGKSQPSVLLGYSMGARAALQHAAQDPSGWKALILISPNPGIEDESERAKRREVDAKLAGRLEAEGVEAFIEFWQNTPMIRSQKRIRADWRDTMQANRREHTVTGLAASLRQFGQGSCPNLWPELGKLSMPTLLITGAEDRKYTRIAIRMLEHLPNGTHETIDEVGHMPHLEAPEHCAEGIRKFLRDL